MPTSNALSYDVIEATIQASPVLPDVPDDRDFLAGAVLGDVALPETYDLRDRQSSVKVQGSRGTCTAFSVTAIAEFFNRTEFGDPNLDLSEEFMFKKTKEIDVADYGYDGYGAYLRSAAKAFQKYGLCREATLPYRAGASESSWRDVAILSRWETEAAAFRAEAYASVAADVTAMQRALVATQAPLLAGFNLYASYRQSSSKAGLIPVRAEGEKNIGGHAMAVVGYTKTHFILKNSWGAGWGDGGYIYWPFAAIRDVFSVWSFIDLQTAIVQPAELRSAQVSRLPDWSREAVNWAMDAKIITHPTGESVPDYRLAVVLKKFEERLAKKFAAK